MLTAKVELTQPLKQQRQFVAQTGSGHHLLLDDAAGGTGPKPIELVAAGLAGCTAFDVVTILRQKYHQKSGARRFEVQLRETSDDVHLTVSDSGLGFDPEAVRKGRGIGLASMQERLHLVNGRISIRSEPKAGTVVSVSVPVGRWKSQ